MRKSLLACIAIGLAMGGPAFAQATCETSVEKDKVGEFIVTYELNKAGAVANLTGVFIPERKDDFGKEGDGFARPGLMLDYRLGADGALTGPTIVSVLLNRFRDVHGVTPSMNGVIYKVTIGEAAPLKWPADSSGYANQLARAIQQGADKLITVEIVGAKDKLLSAAKFDFSKTAELHKLVAEAKAAGDKLVANYAKLAAEGKAGKSCPGG